MGSRLPYSSEENTNMWKYIIRQLRLGNDSASKPMGFTIWQEYVKDNPRCGRSTASLQSHYRRQMHDQVRFANLPLDDILYLFRRTGRKMLESEKTHIEMQFKCRLRKEGNKWIADRLPSDPNLDISDTDNDETFVRQRSPPADQTGWLEVPLGIEHVGALSLDVPSTSASLDRVAQADLESDPRIVQKSPASVSRENNSEGNADSPANEDLEDSCANKTVTESQELSVIPVEDALNAMLDARNSKK
ncbi:hypothetical protein QR680_016147 [Steinernema hermaphroditum]|uniref:SPK domain-containing protein n=1 Tax=Steinernema hermaphroditum TaxID=289476 RepID=A0AA39HC54_9BILA|nr:hypothetical protein QR680_016147 [Steinernema hermaphroditum]